MYIDRRLMTTQEFIQQYREEDVRKLALQGARFPQVDLPYALDQIAGWQTARKKIPSWTARTTEKSGFKFAVKQWKFYILNLIITVAGKFFRKPAGMSINIIIRSGVENS